MDASFTLEVVIAVGTVVCAAGALRAFWPPAERPTPPPSMEADE